MNYRITAKKKKKGNIIKDLKSNNILWDGKPKLITLSTGPKFIMENMFKNLKNYVNKKEWTIKLEKVKK